MSHQITPKLTTAYRTLFFLLCVCISDHSFSDDTQIGGLVVNETITWFGQDFYHYFSREWRNQQQIKNQTIVLEEIPSARQGTQIVIRYKGNIVYQTSIAGTRSSSRERGSNAVTTVLTRVLDIDFSSIGLQQADLSANEL